MVQSLDNLPGTTKANQAKATVPTIHYFTIEGRNYVP